MIRFKVKNDRIGMSVGDAHLVKGEDGKSAYEIAVELGLFNGTEEEWVKSLKGDDGKPVEIEKITESEEDNGENEVVFSDGKILKVRNGSKGSRGEPGETGAQGIQGEKGEKGDKGDPGDDYVLKEEDKDDIALRVKEMVGYDELSEAIEDLRKQSGISDIEMLDSDPVGAELKEGRIWILRVGDNTLTIPVIELGNVSENSIAIELSNASHDENGDVVTTYNIYVNGVLHKTETIAAGGTYVIDDLSTETEYQLSVCGVKGAVLSGMSNTLTATTLEAPRQEIVILPRYTVGAYSNIYGVTLSATSTRAVAVSTSGEQPVPPAINGVNYYILEVPADVTSCTVVCPNLMWGFNGWNTGSDGKLTYDVDSGWKASGVTYTFDAGTAEYVSIGFKKGSAGTEAFAENDEVLAGITITFA